MPALWTILFFSCSQHKLNHLTPRLKPIPDTFATSLPTAVQKEKNKLCFFFFWRLTEMKKVIAVERIARACLKKGLPLDTTLTLSETILNILAVFCHT